MPSNTARPPGLQFDRVAATLAALVVVGLSVFLLVRNQPIADPRLFFVLRVVLSFSAATLGATIPGFLDIRWSGSGLGLRAGGALALFVLTFVYTPDVLPGENPTDPILIAPQPIACSQGDLATPARRSGQECTKFWQPKVRVSNREISLDGCLMWSDQCGQPLWDWFCREMKYSKSGRAENVDRDETYVLLPKRYCERSNNLQCGGPEYITCLR
jgi:hypothetical protein